MGTATIRPSYDMWPQYNRRLRDVVAAMTDEQLAIRPSPDLLPIWATVGHTAAMRVYWLCDVIGEPGAETTPFTYGVADWADDLQHPRGANELVKALDSTFRIVESCLDRWTPDMLEDEIHRDYEGTRQVHTRASILQRLFTHDAYHCGELSQTLGIAGLPQIDLWRQNEHAWTHPFSHEVHCMTDRISPQQFQETEGLEDWRVLADGACIFFRTGSFRESAGLVQAIGDLTGVEDHPPAVDVREGGVTISLITTADDYRGMTQRDVQIAQRISTVARDLGLSADPSAVQNLLIIPGAPNIAAVMPFWRAVLGYEPRPDSPDEDLVDPHGRGAAFWFESMDEPRPDGGGGRSTSGSGCRMTRPRLASRRRSPPAAGWCATTTRPHGGRWLTRPATRRTSPPPWAAADRGGLGRRS